MEITILNVTITQVPTAKGSYEVAEVAYKDDQGKVNGKKIMSFTSKPVFDTLKKAQSNEVYQIVSEKDDKGYWQWKEITKGAAVKTASDNLGFKASPKSTYETPEERAKKQVYIVRQSSINAALEYSKNVKALKTVEEVLALAKQFEMYVFDNNLIEDPIDSLISDEIN